MQPWLVLLLAWGYLQYRLAGPGFIAVATLVGLHLRVRRDERRLRERFGQPYIEYTKRVKRWDTRPVLRSHR